MPTTRSVDLTADSHCRREVEAKLLCHSCKDVAACGSSAQPFMGLWPSAITNPRLHTARITLPSIRRREAPRDSERGGAGRALQNVLLPAAACGRGDRRRASSHWLRRQKRWIEVVAAQWSGLAATRLPLASCSQRKRWCKENVAIPRPRQTDDRRRSSVSFKEERKSPLDFFPLPPPA